MLVVGCLSVAPQLIQKTASGGQVSLQFGQREDGEIMITIRKQVAWGVLYRTPSVKLTPAGSSCNTALDDESERS